MKKYITYLLTLCFLSFSCGGKLQKQYDLVEIADKYAKGDLLGAKSDLEAYVKEENDNELAWTILGHIHEGMDEDSLATVAYHKALAVNPKMVEAITGMGIISRKNEEYEQAAAYYNKALGIDPSYAQAYSSLVTIHILDEKYDEAAKVGLKAFHLDPSDPVIAANLSVAYHYADNVVERNKFFEVAKKLQYHNLEGLQSIFDKELTIAK